MQDFYDRFVLYVSKPHLSITVCADADLLECFRILNPHAPIRKSRIFIRKRLSVVADAKADFIRRQLSSNRGRLSIIADFWSDRIEQHSLLGVCVQFVDNNFEMQHFFIAIDEIKGSHTAEAVKEALDAVRKRYDIREEQIAAYATDNGSNFVSQTYSAKSAIACNAKLFFR